MLRRDIQSSFTASLLRPFFDLSPAAEGPLMNAAPLLAFDSLVDGRPTFGLQRIVGGAFRENLRRCSGVATTAVLTPLEVPPERRTPHWQALCEHVEAFDRLDASRRARLLRLLVYLSFHRLVLRISSRPQAHEIAASHESATIATLRAVSRNVLNAGRRYDTGELEAVVEHAPRHSRSRFYAAVALLVYHAKVTRSVESVRECRAVMESHARPDAPHETFDELMDLSRFYRTASYLHQLEGARERVVAEMDLCEQIARELAEGAADEAERAAALENMHPVLESRAREAEWLGDHELARTRIEELVERDPWDSKVRLEYGQILAAAGELEAAAREFAAAARYGPPGAAPAHFLAGWCYRRLGELDGAVRHHLAALRTDPHGISPVDALGEAGAAAGMAPIRLWCERRQRRPAGAARKSEAAREREVAVAG